MDMLITAFKVEPKANQNSALNILVWFDRFLFFILSQNKWWIFGIKVVMLLLSKIISGCPQKLGLGNKNHVL